MTTGLDFSHVFHIADVFDVAVEFARQHGGRPENFGRAVYLRIYFIPPTFSI